MGMEEERTDIDPTFPGLWTPGPTHLHKRSYQLDLEPPGFLLSLQIDHQENSHGNHNGAEDLPHRERAPG